MKAHSAQSLKNQGFALVVTISLLVLLSVIALGFLSLSAVTLRSGSQEEAQMEARANAKLALQIAIGELQKQVGPDQRITANGEITDPDPLIDHPNNNPKNPHWTGVWDSWIAGPVDPDTVNLNYPGKAPSAQSYHRSVEGESLTGMSPTTYLTGRNDYFRSWLLSLHPNEASNWESAKNLVVNGVPMPDTDADAIRLVGEGSLGEAGDSADYVSVRLLDVKPSGSTGELRGRYGWWVGDESQKARIMGDSYVTDAAVTTAEKISRGQAPGSTGTKTIQGLQNLAANSDTKLTALATQNTLDVLPGAINVPIGNESVKASQWNFHHTSPFTHGVIADVREGGLKRDLSALLERKIDPAEVDNYPNEYSLYKFNTKDQWAQAIGSTTAPQECVPIQDLAAYYQLYDAVSSETDNDPQRKVNHRGVRYSPSTSANGGKLDGINGIHMMSTDFGTTGNSPIYLREYSAIYRQPRIIKIQFLASLFSNLISPPIPADRTNPTPNTHELLLGITPSVTFWNPTNLPVVFRMNNTPTLGAQMLRFRETPIQIRFNKNNGQHITNFASFAYFNASGSQMNEMFNLYWAGVHPIRLEPGEVKTCSLPWSGDASNLKSIHGYNGHWARWNQNFFFKTDTWYVGHEVKVGWEPESFIYSNNSAVAGANNGKRATTITETDTEHVGTDPPPPGKNLRTINRLRFKASDRIQIEIGSGGNTGIGWVNNSSYYQDYINSDPEGDWDRSNSNVEMRQGSAFLQPLFRRGMTNGAANLLSASRSGASIIARSTREAGWPFLHFGMLAGVETNEASNAGFAGGRKFASRPFLHSSTLHSTPFLDNSTANDLYNFGWNWAVDLLNDVYEAPVQVTATGSSYWGGGYTPESGTTHIIQQEIPVVPPMSIAALSHARLGGWSISDQPELPYLEMGQPLAASKRQRTRAVGYGGLRPLTLQAIGNSYAHPQIPAGQTYTTVTRNFGDGNLNETFVDHSYLANKALWDEYFFSSITPQRYEVEVFESTDRTLDVVARDFFFENKAIPNRRIMPYTVNLDDSKLSDMLLKKNDFNNGLADEIAAHLMVEGPFNINSTSVEAWKIFFSSLKKKPVAYLDKSNAMSGGDPVLSTDHEGTPVGQVGLAGGPPFSGSPSSPRNANQWTSWRQLTDTEIDELAVAMVKQVKLRGPFLSLSEFVNRRLEGGAGAAGERSVKGALQAALDDQAVSINSAFRSNSRKFTAGEAASIGAAFPLAAEGPVAYGSSAYIDQADILRGFAEQLTPRGDTFIIRTYGDSIDAGGKVVARAWCEAVVQRLPDYVDTANEPHLKAADPALTPANQAYGRKLEIMSFRWLNASEI